MKATKKLININGNLYFHVSKEQREYLGLDDENRLVEWQDDEGSKGKFISFWKKSKQVMPDFELSESKEKDKEVEPVNTNR